MKITLLIKLKMVFFKGVALDVIMNESKRNNNLDRLLSIDKRLNFILTPHIAGATYTSMKRTEDFIVEKLFNLHIESK